MSKIARFVIWICSKFTRIEGVLKGYNTSVFIFMFTFHETFGITWFLKKFIILQL